MSRFPYAKLMNEIKEDFIVQHWFLCKNGGHFFKGLKNKTCHCATMYGQSILETFHADGCMSWSDYCWSLRNHPVCDYYSPYPNVKAINRMIYKQKKDIDIWCPYCDAMNGACLHHDNYALDAHKIAAACHMIQKVISEYHPLLQELWNQIHRYFFFQIPLKMNR